jgi:hypothetical protein
VTVSLIHDLWLRALTSGRQVEVASMDEQDFRTVIEEPAEKASTGSTATSSTC